MWQSSSAHRHPEIRILIRNISQQCQHVRQAARFLGYANEFILKLQDRWQFNLCSNSQQENTVIRAGFPMYNSWPGPTRLQATKGFKLQDQISKQNHNDLTKQPPKICTAFLRPQLEGSGQQRKKEYFYVGVLVH